MEDIIKRMLRLWDPYDLYHFPADEYDSYAKFIYEFVSSTELLTLNSLTNFVYELLRDGMRIVNSQKYIEIEKLDKESCERFSNLYLAIKELNK